MFVLALILGIGMAFVISLCITMSRLTKSNELGNSTSSFGDLSLGMKMLAKDDGVKVSYVEMLIDTNEKNYRLANEQKKNIQQTQQYNRQIQ